MTARQPRSLNKGEGGRINLREPTEQVDLVTVARINHLESPKGAATYECRLRSGNVFDARGVRNNGQSRHHSKRIAREAR
jgi:hypothetical protein